MEKMRRKKKTDHEAVHPESPRRQALRHSLSAAPSQDRPVLFLSSSVAAAMSKEEIKNARRKSDEKRNEREERN
jgi:hypothetical protein